MLLQEEYELLKASMSDDAARRVYADRAAGLLVARDRYIAARIEVTLPRGGSGVLFVGMQHDATRMLPADFTVTTLRCCLELPAIARLSATRVAEGRKKP